MCESSDTLYCPRCRTRQAFLMSGSGTKGMCLVCGYETKGENVKYLKHLGNLHYTLESGKGRTLWDFITEDIQF